MVMAFGFFVSWEVLYRSIERQPVSKDSVPLGLCNIVHVIPPCTQLQYPAKDFGQVKISKG
jgi:hypothetical protein